METVICYHLDMKLLYLSKRASPDIQLTVSFLTNRVGGPDQHDWKKLGKTLQYLAFTKDLPLNLEALSVQVINIFVDTYFAVNGGMRSHTRGFVTIGKYCVYKTSVHQKMNTKSSMEADLIGVGDTLPQVIWTRYFLDT